MKSLWQPRKHRAFTLVEMLVVIAIIGILAALLLPALVSGKKRALRIECLNDLKQVGTAFQIFAHDHQSKFPMQVPVAEGGSEEYAHGSDTPGGRGFYYSWRQFVPLANDLVTPKPLVCPADLTRTPADSFKTFQNSNLSYAVGINADYNEPTSILSADRNITNSAALTTMMPGLNLSWTRELHVFKGNVLFSDSHVEEWNTVQIPAPDNTVLFLPTVPSGSSGPTMAGPGAPPPPPSQPGNGTTAANGPAGVSRQTAAGGVNAQTFNPPAAPMGKTFGKNTSSASAPGAQNAATGTEFADNSAKEKQRGTATNVVANPLAAPPVEDYELPLSRLFGAASPDGRSNSHWLLWLLLALLIVAGAYVYSRFKRHLESERDED